MLKWLIRDCLLSLAFGRWPRSAPAVPGYSILIPLPADMPFLLTYALEGIRHLDTTHCREILVIPDGSRTQPRAIAQIMARQNDARVRLIPLSAWDRIAINALPRADGGANFRHGLAICRGAAQSTATHIYLHDVDAFWVDPDAIERQYAEALQRHMLALGVTARWDPFYQAAQMEMPGTWELLFSTAWVRSRPPYLIKGARRRTVDGGTHSFDTLLYAQYLDYPSGQIGVMARPPALVHFNGTITTYRVYRRGCRKGDIGFSVVDELFRILLLAILAELLEARGMAGEVPTVAELITGLKDDTVPVRYTAPAQVDTYPEFRQMMEQLSTAPVFAGPRSQKMHELLKPFDDHFAQSAGVPRPTAPTGKLREHGLG